MAATYKVTGSNRSVQQTPGGGFVRTMEVSFITEPSNVAGVIEVPETQYTPEHLAPLLEAAAANIEAIHAL